MSVDKRIQPHPGQSPNSAGRASPNKYVPYKKVSAGTLAGALTIILVWLVNSFVLVGDHALTGEVASALTTVLTFVVSYMVPEA
ncbi:MAG: hypothetical protein R3248_00260 [Candidatus Promineifilaceae bacterium]|nr:hypothetical protein [Candidatus Promineifilaceae bacterium]